MFIYNSYGFPYFLIKAILYFWAFKIVITIDNNKFVSVLDYVLVSKELTNNDFKILTNIGEIL